MSALVTTALLAAVDNTSVLYGGLGALGVGAVGVILALGLNSQSDTDHADVEERIKAFTGARKPAKAAQSSFADKAREKAAEALANNKGLEAKISARLDGAGYSLKPPEWILVHAGVAVGSAFFFLLLSGLKLPFLVVGLAIGAVGPWIFLGMKRSRRLKAFQNTLPDTLQLMAGSLSAGLSLAQSVDTIVREGAEPITSEFRRVVVESRLGVALEDAMEGVAERMDSKDFGWVVMAIRIQRDVGGNLAELLLTVAATLREREYIRRHVRALSAEGRLSMYVLGGLPPVFLLYLSLSKWSYVSPLFTTPIGYGLLGLMSVLLGVGCFWMAKVSKVNF